MRSPYGSAVFGIRLVLCAALVGMLAGLVPPARPAEARVITHAATLRPIQQEQGGGQHQHPNTGLLGCYIPPPRYLPDVGALDPVRVGFSNNSDDCDFSWFYQAQVVFDLSELMRYPLAEGRPIVARLTYHEEVQARSDPPPFGSQGVTCVDRLRIASSDRFETRDGDLAHTSPRADGLPALKSDPWSAADAVEGWLSGAFPNFGLVLHGYDEALSKNSNKCLSELSNFELEVAVFWDVPPAADLQVLKLEAADKSGAAGCATGSVDAVATVRNEGDAGATFEVLLKVDGRPRETLVVAVGPYGDVRADFPTVGLGAGPHSLEAIVDPDDEVEELGLSDQAKTRSIQVTCASGAAAKPAPTAADLQVAEVEVQDATGVARCVAGTANNVRTVIKNAGDTGVNGAITVQLIVDKQPAATATVGGMEADSDKASNFSGVSLAAGTHTLQVKVDPENKVPEAVEDNNTSQPKTVTCAGQAAGTGAAGGEEQPDQGDDNDNGDDGDDDDDDDDNDNDR